MILPAAALVITPAVLALCADIAEAIKRARIKQSAAADDMTLSEQRLSEFQNHGTTPLDVRRLAILAEKNPSFCLELIDILARRHGLAVVRSDVAELIDGVEGLVRGRARMAKAKLPSTAVADERRIS